MGADLLGGGGMGSAASCPYGSGDGRWRAGHLVITKSVEISHVNTHNAGDGQQQK